ncbi:Factor arrest protein 11 [Sporothrix epigloea]|uniref:Factor arrest protein 11 n=1 Tax=Sporothrix epigloea TaxID=1892477 RepID=A0ABP0DUQ6_9PEZI
MSNSPSKDAKSPGEAQPLTGNIAGLGGSPMSREVPGNSALMTEEAKRAAPQAGNTYTHPLNRMAPGGPMSFEATPKDAVGGSKGASVPAPAPQPPQQPLDSLSLSQLRRLASEFPRNEPITYSYTYEDMGDFDEEIDEWFSYQVLQWVRLNQAHQHFESRWQRLVQHSKPNGRQSHDREPDQGAPEGEEPENEITWDTADAETQESFVSALLSDLWEEEQCRSQRSEVIGCFVYIVLGRWGSSAYGRDPEAKSSLAARTVARPRQLDAIKSAVALITKLGGFPILWKSLREAFDPFWGPGDMQQLPTESLQDAQEDLAKLMTIFYVVIQTALSNPLDEAAHHINQASLSTPIPDFMMKVASKLRWDDSPMVLQCQVFLLLWKSILLVFGGTRELLETKKATAQSTADEDKEKNLIMASPLDYHAFRQEITSKYPAYMPPRPLLPLEDDSTTILPPPLNHPVRNNGQNGILPGPQNAYGGASILNQPVHIATPAPSPPPSPAIGGKGGKKQNYQTNQNFPFMYPPLDATSNGAGGKGPAAMQEALVGKRWEGSDVPSSILEAGELFSNRVRMTRSTRQIWDEREKFLKYERGWDGNAEDDPDRDVLDELDLSDLTLEEQEELGLVKAHPQNEQGQPEENEVDYGPRPEELDTSIKQRLLALESLYKEALPHLQSLVIVLLKAILVNVAVLLAQAEAGQQQHPAAGGPNRGGYSSAYQMPGSMNQNNLESAEMTPEEVDSARTREINAKAVSGILLLLLKWLKVSHVLKSEYLTQLLLDCNYVPLLLKLWAHQDVQQLIDAKTDRVESSFFYFCNVRAGGPEDDNQIGDAYEGDLDSEDDVAPPAIRRHRSPSAEAKMAYATNNTRRAGAPQVDELGYPIGEVPIEPITDFSRRNFFSLINLLRVMQKICKNKAHRNLLLVHYKSSNILRKMLKVPQQELRLYTLKLFKNQVPYCGRKWRQSNMRVITAIYLHCRPDLRDEWLAGSDVDGEVESSLPLEQALRSLTHWYNMRQYQDKMAPEVSVALREEYDFFVHELEKIDFAIGEINDSESIMSEWDS